MVTQYRRWVVVFLAIASLMIAIGVWAQDDSTATEAANREAVTAWLQSLADPELAVGEPAVVTGNDALKDHLVKLEMAFPDFTLEVNEMIVEGDSVAVRVTFHGVQRGAFDGVPPTGHTVDVPIILFLHMENGHVVDIWMQGDVLGLMTDLESALLYHALAVSSDEPAHDCGSLISVKGNP